MAGPDSGISSDEISKARRKLPYIDLLSTQILPRLQGRLMCKKTVFAFWDVVADFLIVILFSRKVLDGEEVDLIRFRRYQLYRIYE